LVAQVLSNHYWAIIGFPLKPMYRGKVNASFYNSTFPINASNVLDSCAFLYKAIGSLLICQVFDKTTNGG
jgi:hypothetical protein